MASPEMSLAFSIEQLTHLQVCLDCTKADDPPNLTFDMLPQQEVMPSLSTQLSDISVNLETFFVNGRRTLKIYATSKNGNSISQNSIASSITSPVPSSTRSSRSASIEQSFPPTPVFALPQSSSMDICGVDASEPVPAPQWGNPSKGMSHLEALQMGSHTLQFPSTSSTDKLSSDLFKESSPITSSSSSSSPYDATKASGPFSFDSPNSGADSYMTFGFSDVQDSMARCGLLPSILPSGDDNAFSNSFVPNSNPTLDPFGWQIGHDFDGASSTSSSSPTFDSYAHSFDVGSPSSSTSFTSLSPLEGSDTITFPSTDEPKVSGSRSRATDGVNEKKSRKSNAKRIYKCPHDTCDRRFRSEYTCRVHAGSHAPKPRKIVECTFADCKETFTRQHDRLRHEVNKHGKVCEWSCVSCRKFFSSAEMLDKHTCSSHHTSR